MPVLHATIACEACPPGVKKCKGHEIDGELRFHVMTLETKTGEKVQFAFGPPVIDNGAADKATDA